MPYQSMEKTKQQTTIHTDLYCDYAATDDPYVTAKAVAILSYFTLLGWFIAIVLHGAHKSSFATFHLRQSLGLIISGALLAFIPLIGWVLNVTVCLAWFYALYYVVQGQERSVPLLGQFYQDHLDFIK